MKIRDTLALIAKEDSHTLRHGKYISSKALTDPCKHRERTFLYGVSKNKLTAKTKPLQGTMQNVSNDSLGENGGEPPAAASMAAAACASLLALVIISGNILVITAFYKETNIRSIANSFLVSLSCADLLVGGVIIPFYIALDFVNNGYWEGQASCYFFLALDVSACTASILHLCIISADRYMAIVHPMTYPLRMTRKLSLILICAAWSLSLGVSFPWMYYGYVVEPFSQENTCPLPNSALYNVLSSFISFFIPFAIIVILYRKMFLTAQAHFRRIQKGRLELSGGGHDTMRIHRGGTGSLTNNLHLEYKAAKTTGLVIGAFLLCWFPFSVVFVIHPWCGDTCDAVRGAFAWLGFVNSAVNPFIYALTNSSFKMTFMKILCFMKNRRSQASAKTETSLFQKGGTLAMNEYPLPHRYF